MEPVSRLCPLASLCPPPHTAAPCRLGLSRAAEPQAGQDDRPPRPPAPLPHATPRLLPQVSSLAALHTARLPDLLGYLLLCSGVSWPRAGGPGTRPGSLEGWQAGCPGQARIWVGSSKHLPACTSRRDIHHPSMPAPSLEPEGTPHRTSVTTAHAFARVGPDTPGTWPPQGRLHFLRLSAPVQEAGGHRSAQRLGGLADGRALVLL